MITNILKQIFAVLSLEYRALKEASEKRALKPVIKRELADFLISYFRMSTCRTLSLIRKFYSTE